MERVNIRSGPGSRGRSGLGIQLGYGGNSGEGFSDQNGLAVGGGQRFRGWRGDRGRDRGYGGGVGCGRKRDAEGTPMTYFKRTFVEDPWVEEGRGGSLFSKKFLDDPWEELRRIE